MTSFGREVERGQLVGVEPDPHRIVERPEQGRLADAADARQGVDDVDRRVVAEIERVIAALGRIELDDLEQRRGDFLRMVRPWRVTSGGSCGCGQRGAVLHVDGVDVGIGPEREGDVERIAAVGAAGRLVVERVVDAVDLLLDRLRHGRLDDLGVGAGIGSRERDLRRHDVGELRHRDRDDRDDAGQRDDDRDDEGEPRPVDEDGGDQGVQPARPERAWRAARRCQAAARPGRAPAAPVAATWPGPHLLHAVDDDLLALLEAALDDDVGAFVGPVVTRRCSALWSAPTTSTYGPAWSTCKAACGTTKRGCSLRSLISTVTNWPSTSWRSGLGKVARMVSVSVAWSTWMLRNSTCRHADRRCRRTAERTRNSIWIAQLSACLPLGLHDRRGADREGDVDRVLADDGGEHVAGGVDQVAEGVGGEADVPVDRRPDLGVAVVHLGLVSSACAASIEAAAIWSSARRMSTSDLAMLLFLTSSSPRFSCAAVLAFFASALASSA